MSGDVSGYTKAMNEVQKDKLRKQMHHDLCVLSAGAANFRGAQETAAHAMHLYKELWHQVMKEIP